MVKYSFQDDYSEGAHPRLLDAIAAACQEQQPGYGLDSYCLEAVDLIRERVGRADADVHFAASGTQANIVVLSSMLRPYESAIAAETGHINVHEAGGIEATGHKVHPVPTPDGKLSPESVRGVVESHTDEHMVKPRVVFVSQSTELGTVYSFRELEELADVCRRLDLLLYLDGARLASALASPSCDLDLPSIASRTDAFYIGGTKNGALLGEAIVVTNPELQPRFRFHLKQRGALLAKARVFGAQFLELFRDDLYLELARHANSMAEQLAQGIRAVGYQLPYGHFTNQVLVLLPMRQIEKLQESYRFYVWSKVDQERALIRLVTSWTTPEAAVTGFLQDLKRL